MRHVALFVFLGISFPSSALEVITDAGGEPIAPYLERLAPPDGQANRRARAPIALADRAYSLKQYLPIRSPSLTPGLVEVRQTPTRLLQPVFLVGADPKSLEWLEVNRERLRQLNAIGMLVQAENNSELEAVAAAAQGLPLIPASGEAFAAELPIRHYPVLLTSKGVSP
jgi:integrating conjugative element protein (TIGR03765 family)